MFQEVIDVFAQQGKLGFSAIIKVSEQVGAAKSTLRKVPNQGSQEEVPKQGFPGRGSQARFPSKLPKVPNNRFLRAGFQVRVLSQFPSKVSKQGSQRFP